jgi:hypothetical protein
MTPQMVLRLWIPLGYGFFFAGLAISIVVRCSDHPFRLEDAILSDLLSRFDNPHGYLVASGATTLCGFLLLPVASYVQMRLNTVRHWTVLGAWLYRLGLFAAVAVGITTPFQQAYVPIHIYLAFLAFMSVVAGLAVLLATAACTVKAWRWSLRALAGVEAAFLFFLAYVFVTPDFFHDRRDWLAICEWVLCGSIAVGTAVLAAALKRADASSALSNHAVPAEPAHRLK